MDAAVPPSEPAAAPWRIDIQQLVFLVIIIAGFAFGFYVNGETLVLFDRFKADACTNVFFPLAGISVVAVRRKIPFPVLRVVTDSGYFDIDVNRIATVAFVVLVVMLAFAVGYHDMLAIVVNEMNACATPPSFG